MGELLFQYGPPVLAWTLFLSRPAGGDPARRCLRRVLLGLAISLTVLTPVVYVLVGELSGIEHLARLIGHGGMLFTAWAAQEFLSHMNRLDRGSRWHAVWIIGTFTVMCALFVLAPNLAPWTPGVLEYCVVYLLGQAPAFGNVIRLCLRYARVADATALRIGVRLIAAGTACAMVYLVNKVVRTAAARFGFDYHLDDTFVVSQALPATAHILVLVGATLPAVLGWLRRYHQYQRLGPLWRALYRADPAIALNPPVTPDVLQVGRLRLRLYRRVIEIRDGLLALHPYREHHVAVAARERAVLAGMSGQRLAATVEAATVAAALGSCASGNPPSTVRVPLAGGGDLDSDTAFLSQVALAFRDNHTATGPLAAAAITADPGHAAKRRDPHHQVGKPVEVREGPGAGASADFQ